MERRQVIRRLFALANFAAATWCFGVWTGEHGGHWQFPAAFGAVIMVGWFAWESSGNSPLADPHGYRGASGPWKSFGRAAKTLPPGKR